jgi:hypothetical protein
VLPIDSDTLALAGGDGNITIITVQPNTVIGVMGQHDGELPVEQLRWSADRRFIAR